MVVPPFLKAGLSLARSAAPTPLRMPSSAVTVTVRSLPSLSFTTVVTGTISAIASAGPHPYPSYQGSMSAIWRE